MVRIKLVDSSLREGDGRIVPALADAGLNPLVDLGSAVDMPDDVAGQAPSDEDPGWGLLAQSDVWVLAEGSDD